LTLTANSIAATGTFSLNITGTSGPLSNATTLALTVNVPPNPGLPSIWTDGDIGSVGVAGSAGFANGTFTAAGAGNGTFYSTSDGFHFVYQPLSGDGTIVARVVSMQGSSAAQAGIMIRETLDPGANHIYLFNYSSAVWLTERTSTGASSSYQSFASVTLPNWIKLSRSGNVFNMYGSPDGVNWAQLGSSQTVSMAPNVYIGLAVSNRTTSSLATATFDGVSVSSAASPAPVITGVSATTGSIGGQVVISGSGFGASQGSSVVLLNGGAVTINAWSGTSITMTIPPGATSGPLLVSVAPSMNDSNAIPFAVTSQPLPVSWLDQDVGAVGVAGSATYTNGTFTVMGAGQGTFFSSSDGFHYVYQALTGDGAIVARVVSMQGSSAAQAGIMVRETLDAAANHVYLFNYSSADWMTERTSTGASSSYQSFGSVTLPNWIKLSRSGNAFTMYSSPDGVNWTQLGASQAVNMAPSVCIGLAASSRDTSSLVVASFDNVSVSAP
jgi:regulation of enolase protein 1 (concanavalin A-like superfamily)